MELKNPIRWPASGKRTPLPCSYPFYSFPPPYWNHQNHQKYGGLMVVLVVRFFILGYKKMGSPKKGKLWMGKD